MADHETETMMALEVKSGDESIPAVLDRGKSDPIAGKTKVSQLVRALPGYGPAKVIRAGRSL